MRGDLEMERTITLGGGEFLFRKEEDGTIELLGSNKGLKGLFLDTKTFLNVLFQFLDEEGNSPTSEELVELFNLL